MPVPNYQTYCSMLDHAYNNKYAYPAINVASMEAANAALKGFAEAKSDGIIQISIGGGIHASGVNVKDSAMGAISLANHVHIMAQKYSVYVALHSDHCRARDLDTFVYPLIAETERRRSLGLNNLFNSHMFDGSDISLDQNIAISKELIALCSKNEIILEVEAGVFGGEEDGVNNEGITREKLYTTQEDMLAIYDSFNGMDNVRYMLAATFGNVHGVYKPGNVKLKPKILHDGQQAVRERYGDNAFFYFVFHGGSGSDPADIEETLNYGVVKMNIDTDTQYAFSRPLVDHMFKNYDGVLKLEGEVGIKKAYDPRTFLKKAEVSMADRVREACHTLKSAANTLYCK